MAKTITAIIPARRLTAKAVRPARTETIVQDDDGRWSKVCDALEAKATGKSSVALTERDVIDILRWAKDWPAIRAEHFPMFGFHN